MPSTQLRCGTMHPTRSCRSSCRCSPVPRAESYVRLTEHAGRSGSREGRSARVQSDCSGHHSAPAVPGQGRFAVASIPSACVSAFGGEAACHSHRLCDRSWARSTRTASHLIAARLQPLVAPKGRRSATRGAAAAGGAARQRRAATGGGQRGAADACCLEARPAEQAGRRQQPSIVVRQMPAAGARAAGGGGGGASARAQLPEFLLRGPWQCPPSVSPLVREDRIQLGHHPAVVASAADSTTAGWATAALHFAGPGAGSRRGSRAGAAMTSRAAALAAWRATAATSRRRPPRVVPEAARRRPSAAMRSGGLRQSVMPRRRRAAPPCGLNTVCDDARTCTVSLRDVMAFSCSLSETDNLVPWRCSHFRQTP